MYQSTHAVLRCVVLTLHLDAILVPNLGHNLLKARDILWSVRKLHMGGGKCLAYVVEGCGDKFGVGEERHSLFCFGRVVPCRYIADVI